MRIYLLPVVRFITCIVIAFVIRFALSNSVSTVPGPARHLQLQIEGNLFHSASLIHVAYLTSSIPSKRAIKGGADNSLKPIDRFEHLLYFNVLESNSFLYRYFFFYYLSYVILLTFADRTSFIRHHIWSLLD